MLLKSECKALFHAEELASAVLALKKILPDLVLERLISLVEILKTKDDIKHYAFDKTFDEARDEPCLILHTSGSTGMHVQLYL